MIEFPREQKTKEKERRKTETEREGERLSHLLERGKLWNENICKYLSIPRHIEKAEKRLREKERAKRREREKAMEGEMCSINAFCVLLCSFLIFLLNLLYLICYRSSHPEVFLGKGVLKICSKFTEEHLCQSVISIKLQSSFRF